MSRGQDQFMLRLPDGMRDAIAAVAKAGDRSMNTEIVRRLKDSLAATLPCDSLQPETNDIRDAIVMEAIRGAASAIALDYSPADYPRRAQAIVEAAHALSDAVLRLRNGGAA